MITDLFKTIVDYLYQAPGWLLVILISIIIGYALRAIKSFPNGAIPLTVIIIGALSNCFMAGDEPPGTSHRAWLVRNMIVGAILGFLAWRLHKRVLAKYEDKIPFLKGLLSSTNGDTNFFANPDKPVTNQTNPTNPDNPAIK